jgi:RNA polymerase sigma factor (sigma-70 family)
MASLATELPVLARDEAFELLYRRYVQDVYHYALALLRNPADAEDVTQTTFMNAYRAYKRGDVIEKPQHWLIKIAHNVARTRYARASRRVKEVPLEEHVEQLAVAEEDRPNVEGVLRALGRLPFNQRAALVMRELEGRSYAEIAETIGVSVPAVETLIFRARKSLRLRVSALRALAVVPLPSSLAQLFEGGGVVAGGGALAGTGFLVKAAVALVAGAVVTGIGGDHTGRATAAPEPAAPLAAAPPWADGSGLIVRQLPAAGVKASQVPGAHGVRHSPVATASGSRLGATFAARKHFGGTSAPSSTSTSGSAPAQQTTVVEVVAPVTDLVGEVEQTVAASTSTLPVQAPTLPPLPPLPVDVPSPPKLP